MKPPEKILLPLALVIAGAPALAQQEREQPIDEVIVYGVRDAELNAREQERDRDNFSTIITTDDAGDFADQNVAESLQRLPGITLQRSEGEGRFINLRGLGPGFTSVTMNDSELASGSGGPGGDEGRGFSLDAVNADVLQAIEVNKTLMPDMDLNSIGGSVNLRTVSALDRARNQLKLQAQGVYQDLNSATSPKFTVQGTNIFADHTFGIAYSGSWEKRKTRGFEVRTHDTDLPRFVTVDDQTMLIPWELQNRQENAERERIAGNISLDWRPHESGRYYARYSRTEFEDVDIAFREYYRFAQAPDVNVVYLDPENNIFGLSGGDLQHQTFIQEGKTTTDIFALGGQNVFGGERWQLDYEAARSRADLDKPGARRVQFRTRDLPMLGRSGRGFVNGQIVHPGQLAELAGLDSVPGGSGFGPSGYQLGETQQPFMLYDNLFLEDSFRNDTIDQFTLDLQRNFDHTWLNHLKAGTKIKQRDRDRDRDRVSIVPSDKAPLGCGGDLDCVAMAGSLLGDFDTRMQPHPGFDHAHITLGEAERLLAATRIIGDNFDPDGVGVESTRLDFEVSEDATAGYLMGEFQVAPGATLIAGARYEHTRFDSTGFLSIRNDREESAEQLESFDIAVPLDAPRHSYGRLFPSVHYRHELSDQLLLRAAAWTSFTRPEFDQARARFEVRDRVIFCNNDPAANLGVNNCSDRPTDLQGDIDDIDFTDEYKASNLEMGPQNSVVIGNPFLKPMTATNLDLSLGWLAGENLFLQGAVFYKDISDFIVQATGVDMAISDLPFDVPVDQVDRFVIPEDLELTNVNTFLNGDRAQVFGLELSYSQFFTERHGLLNHFFVQSNLTWLHSRAKPGNTVRDERIRLPNQADWSANLTLGWENQTVSLRLIGTYHSKILKRIGACTAADRAADAEAGLPLNCQDWADVFQSGLGLLDFRAAYRINRNFRVFFDATNLTGEVDRQYFAGNSFSSGNQLFRLDDWGSTYQLGVTVDF